MILLLKKDFLNVITVRNKIQEQCVKKNGVNRIVINGKKWKKLNAERRTRYKDFYARLEPGGDLAKVQEYFTDIGEKFNDNGISIP